MFRFDNYMEQWATIYKPFQHIPDDPKDARFFRVNDEMLLDEFLQRYQQLDVPCCGIVTHLEGTVNVPKRLEQPLIKFLFFARADETDYPAQSDAKATCYDHAWKFLLHLQHGKDQFTRTERNHPLSHLDLTNVRYDMLGPITNGWFELIVTVQVMQYSPQCYSEEDYIK